MADVLEKIKKYVKPKVRSICQEKESFFQSLSLNHFFQLVHVGAAREHQEALHLPVGGVHQLLRPTVPTHGLHDW